MPDLTLDQRERNRERGRQRARRKREVRARSVATNRALAAERRQAHERAAYYDIHRVLPLTRGECVRSRRPCPFVSCQYNLYLDIHARSGSMKFNFPDLEPWQMPESCALDVADRGGATLEHVGALMNVTPERCRQIEMQALAKLKGNPDARLLRVMWAESGGV